MSKRALKKYLKSLPKEALELQLMEAYEKFPSVKKYYDFIFNPREEKLVQEAKAKIANEYFPVRRKRARARRSVAQKFIRHFISLGMDPHWVAELMLFNIRTALDFAPSRKQPQAFYQSVYRSFGEMVQFVVSNGMLAEMENSIRETHQRIVEQRWPNREDFERIMDSIDLSS